MTPFYVPKLDWLAMCFYACSVLFIGAEGMKEDLEELTVEEEDEEEESVAGCTLFIKNLSFATTEETLREVSSG